MKVINGIRLTDDQHDKLVITAMMLGMSKKKAVAYAVKKLNQLADDFMSEEREKTEEAAQQDKQEE